MFESSPVFHWVALVTFLGLEGGEERSIRTQANPMLPNSMISP